MNKDVIVTGGAGFIGSNIVSALKVRGYKVYVFDNLSTGNKKNLDLENIKFFKLDLKTNHENWPKMKSHYRDYGTLLANWIKVLADRNKAFFMERVG